MLTMGSNKPALIASLPPLSYLHPLISQCSEPGSPLPPLIAEI